MREKLRHSQVNKIREYMDSMSAPQEIIKHLTSSRNKRILNSNLNPHEEVKNTG